MTQLGFCIAVLYWLSLTGVAVGAFAMLRARSLFRQAEKRAEVRWAQYEAGLDAAREQAECCARQVREIERLPAAPPASPPGPGRSGLNLSKRSQALRMHRRGDPPEKIAAALEIPQQELELLLKVHRIVIADL